MEGNHMILFSHTHTTCGNSANNNYDDKNSNSLMIMITLHIVLTHWGRVTNVCVSELTTIGSGNGLSPGRRKAIIWNNAGLLLIEPLGTNFSEISIGIQTFSFKKMHLNMSSAKWHPFCLGFNVVWGMLQFQVRCILCVARPSRGIALTLVIIASLNPHF